MDIKEIALKVADSLRNKIDGISHMQSNQGLVRFAEALIAELAKQNEPVVTLKSDDFGWGIWEDNLEHKPAGSILNLFTFPPTAEQIAKQNKPVAFLHEWSEYHPFGDTVVGEPFATITNDEKPFDSSDTVSPLFTFPPTAEQIANETAEACAKACEDVIGNTPHDQRMLAAIDCAVMLRSGAWKEFK